MPLEDLYICDTSKCTCPIVQEQMITYYNDNERYAQYVSQSTNVSQETTTAPTPEHYMALDFS